MANTDKNIVITPNVGSASTDPQIVFSGASSTVGPQNITLRAYPTNNGTLSFEGSAGQLFSVTNSFTGTIFSVNDVSGVPSIEVLDSGLVKIAQYSGNVLLGTATDNGTAKLQVNGNLSADAASLNTVKSALGSSVNWQNVGTDILNIVVGLLTSGPLYTFATEIPAGQSFARFDISNSGGINLTDSTTALTYVTGTTPNAWAQTHIVDYLKNNYATLDSTVVAKYGAGLGIVDANSSVIASFATDKIYVNRVLNSTVSSGAPFTVASNGKVTNLNADLLDGISSASFIRTDTAGDWSVASATNSASYTSAALEVRELSFNGAQTGVTSESPRISFHWGGRVASQIGIETSGRIAILSNPGTAYENLIASTVYGNAGVQTTNLTTGDALTSGTVTGTWTLTASSTWQATFADLAEWYTSDVDYEAGTVVVFGGIAETTISTTANDSKVAGVVSTNPAFIMNVDQPGPSACVALQGKVPVKVTGQVAKGDLLVTSDVAGVAMVNNAAAPYTVIGKALENKTTLEQGLVYVSVGR